MPAVHFTVDLLKQPGFIGENGVVKVTEMPSGERPQVRQRKSLA